MAWAAPSRKPKRPTSTSKSCFSGDAPRRRLIADRTTSVARWETIGPLFFSFIPRVRPYSVSAGVCDYGLLSTGEWIDGGRRTATIPGGSRAKAQSTQRSRRFFASFAPLRETAWVFRTPVRRSQTDRVHRLRLCPRLLPHRHARNADAKSILLESRREQNSPAILRLHHFQFLHRHAVAPFAHEALLAGVAQGVLAVAAVERRVGQAVE